MDNINVDVEKLKDAARGINSKREEMYNTYNSKILPLLNNIEECLSVSGISYDEILTAFRGVFTGLNSQLGNLTDALNNKIIPEYEESISIVSNIFNNEFAGELRSILSRMNAGGTPINGGIKPPINGGIKPH